MDDCSPIRLDSAGLLGLRALPSPSRPCIATVPAPAARSRNRCRRGLPPVGWCPLVPWRRAFHRQVRRALRHDAMRDRPGFAGFKLRRRARRMVIPVDGKDQKRPAETENPKFATGDDRGLHRRDRGAGPGGRVADAGLRRAGLSGGDAPSGTVTSTAAARCCARTS